VAHGVLLLGVLGDLHSNSALGNLRFDTTGVSHTSSPLLKGSLTPSIYRYSLKMASGRHLSVQEMEFLKQVYTKEARRENGGHTLDLMNVGITTKYKSIEPQLFQDRFSREMNELKRQFEEQKVAIASSFVEAERQRVHGRRAKDTSRSVEHNTAPSVVSITKSMLFDPKATRPSTAVSARESARTNAQHLQGLQRRPRSRARGRTDSLNGNKTAKSLVRSSSDHFSSIKAELNQVCSELSNLTVASNSREKKYHNQQKLRHVRFKSQPSLKRVQSKSQPRVGTPHPRQRVPPNLTKVNQSWGNSYTGGKPRKKKLNAFESHVQSRFATSTKRGYTGERDNIEESDPAFRRYRRSDTVLSKYADLIARSPDLLTK